MANEPVKNPQPTEPEWIVLPGGELEGRRPKLLCGTCRARREAGEPLRPLCFQCYRAAQDRDTAFATAARLETATESRFQVTLPFEPVDRFGLDGLKAKRAQARAALPTSANFDVRRRVAQIAARKALLLAGEAIRDSRMPDAARRHALAAALHAAELQLPESWLPFVVAEKVG
jgi:hypothetical protein